jgi:hypothetical protein
VTGGSFEALDYMGFIPDFLAGSSFERTEFFSK